MTSPPEEYLPIALRAFAVRDRPDERAAKQRWPVKPPRHVLIIDTETTTDVTQALNFGCYQFCTVRPDGSLTGLEEGLFYGADLADRYPDGLSELQRYVHGDPAGVPGHLARVDDDSGCAANWRLMLRPLDEFMERVIWRAAYRLHATVVFFNAPFDLSRLAIGSGKARGRAAGGFSLKLFEDDYNRCRVAYKVIDSKRAIMRLTSPADVDEADLERHPETGEKRLHHGHLLDLRTLVFALTNESHTLASACRAFGIEATKHGVERHGEITGPYVDYCRQDVALTGLLYERAMAEHRRHPVDLQPTKTYSPASIAKAYLERFGVEPVLRRQPDFPKKLLGEAMAAFYGGRAECHIRRTPLPVALVDFTSMYPTVDILLGISSLLSAQRIDVVDATQDVQALLDRATVEDCLNPASWVGLVGFAQIDADGEALPVRAQYRDGDPAWNIGVNHLHADQPMWYSLPDLVAATLLSGKAPRVLQAVRLVGVGQADGLRPVRLRGDVPIDPAREDPYKAAVEQRQTLKALAGCDPEAGRTAAFLKVFANAGSYGIYAEMNRHELPARTHETVTVYGNSDRPFTCKVAAPEEPGEYCFPPIAACITGAARLMLATLERLVTDAGGTWMFCDTDSMAIVATPTGGLHACPGGPRQLPDGTPAVRALSFTEVASIQERLNALNPYNCDAVPDVLKLEAVGDCLVISAKRYAIYHLEDGEVSIDRIVDNEEHEDDTTDDKVDDVLVIDKQSEHGLGHLLNPTDPDNDDRDWIRQAWEWLIRRELGLPAPEPDWLDRPALTRITVSSPHLLAPFKTWNAGKPYPKQIKPANFILAAHIDPLLPAGVDASRFRLIAPYDPDATRWAGLDWRNLYDRNGPSWRITTRQFDGMRLSDGTVRVKTYRDILNNYLAHPEAKFNGPDGHPCQPGTRGVLQRRTVRAASFTDIGKEANRLEDVQAGLIGDLDDVLNTYPDPRNDALRTLLLPVLAPLSSRQIAARTGMSKSAVNGIRNGASPHRRHRESLTAVAVDLARDELCSAGFKLLTVPDEALLAACLDNRKKTSPRRERSEHQCR